MKSLLELVRDQAEDEGLWFIASTASEAYLQQALRKIHAMIESQSAHNHLHKQPTTKRTKRP